MCKKANIEEIPNPEQNIPNGNNDKSETKRPSKKMCANHSNVKLHVEPILEDSGANIEIIRASVIQEKNYGVNLAKNNGHLV